MTTNVSEKDKTLNEIIDMCVEKRVHYRQFLNDFMLTHSEDWHDSEADVTYGERIMFLRGKIQAFDECAACCESMLGRTAPPTNAEIEAVAKRLCWNSCKWDGVDSYAAKDEDDAWDYAGEIPGFHAEYIRQAKELLALARRAVTE